MPRSIPGLDGEFVYTPYQLLQGKVELKDKKVCMVGSGITGLETTEYLNERNNKVTMLEMTDEIGHGVMFQNLIDVMGRINAAGTENRYTYRVIKRLWKIPKPISSKPWNLTLLSSRWEPLPIMMVLKN